jgi:hypothetical protein
MAYELWTEITVTVGSALGLLGFFRSQEQRKDAAFRELAVGLCNRESPLMRAFAARQLPSYYRYRRYFLLKAPYASQAVSLATYGLNRLLKNSK